MQNNFNLEDMMKESDSTVNLEKYINRVIDKRVKWLRVVVIVFGFSVLLNFGGTVFKIYRDTKYINDGQRLIEEQKKIMDKDKSLIKEIQEKIK